jgi:hypothetical protein
VKQGTLGNCYFQSVVAALAGTNPAAIAKMIRANSRTESSGFRYPFSSRLSAVW